MRFDRPSWILYALEFLTQFCFPSLVICQRPQYKLANNIANMKFLLVVMLALAGPMSVAAEGFPYCHPTGKGYSLMHNGEGHPNHYFGEGGVKDFKPGETIPIGQGYNGEGKTLSSDCSYEPDPTTTSGGGANGDPVSSNLLEPLFVCSEPFPTPSLLIRLSFPL